MGIYDAMISGKGQLTVPIELRRKLGIETAGKVMFKVSENGSVTISAKRKGLTHLKGIFARPNAPIDIDAEIMASVAEEDHPRRRISAK
jgi:bifunctional DNA-binding transcriptional regulator/antitoxin component of YhaV-PrlF toxin-antitoxin module